MAKILYVADGMQRSIVKVLLEQRGHTIKIVKDFDEVTLFLGNEPDVTAIIWEVTANGVIIAPDHISRVKKSFPSVRNFGVAGGPIWLPALQGAGCLEVFRFFDLVDGVCNAL